MLRSQLPEHEAKFAQSHLSCVQHDFKASDSLLSCSTPPIRCSLSFPQTFEGFLRQFSLIEKFSAYQESLHSLLVQLPSGRGASVMVPVSCARYRFLIGLRFVVLEQNDRSGASGVAAAGACIIFFAFGVQLSCLWPSAVRDSCARFACAFEFCSAVF
jgi:hypothetical protein